MCLEKKKTKNKHVPSQRKHFNENKKKNIQYKVELGKN